MNRKLPFICFALSVALWTIFYFVFYEKTERIFPVNRAVDFYAYGDASDGGVSTASWSFADSILSCDFFVKPAIDYPYAGVGMNFVTDAKKLNAELIDFSSYDSICVTLRTERINQIHFKILTFDPSFTKLNSPLSSRFLFQPLPTARAFQEICLALNDFTIPEWWFSKNAIQTPDQSKFLDRVMKLDFSSGVERNVTDKLEIKDIHLVGRARVPNFCLIALMIAMLLWILMSEWIFYSREKMEQSIKKEHALDSYNQIAVESHSVKITHNVMGYLQSHYGDAELSLESACKGIGVDRNKLSEILKQESGMTFSAYVNELRLKEAARLLKESDLQVAEVASSVCIDNPSHFNKMFKLRYAQTPLEYRKSFL
ncbi:MAG: AraC family transcriptional regulator [Fibrobacteraceae bacterium]|nr:AraC family transcriptional regulator [Fibrobacteraceae bacterium]